MEELTKQIMANRDFLKCPNLSAPQPFESDQRKGLPQPPLDKPATGELVQLPCFAEALVHPAYTDLLDLRRSERVYLDAPVTQEQLAFMLWSTQGVQGFRGDTRYASLRPVPSGGARHPFETYIAVRNVAGLKPGLYHYLPFAHEGEKKVTIQYLGAIADYDETMAVMLAGQKWGVNASFVLFYTCVAYRAEWRYSSAAHRVVLIDLGHVGQNVMLSATALGLGSCCLAAYDSKLCDEVLGVDGVEEFTVYVIPVGVIK